MITLKIKNLEVSEELVIVANVNRNERINSKFQKVVDGSLVFLDPTIQRDGGRVITRVHRTPTQTQNIPFRYIITPKTISMIHQTSFFFVTNRKT